MTQLLNKKTLYTAVLCLGGAAVLLHPASLFTLGMGAVLGCRGKDWIKRFWDDRGRLCYEDRGGQLPKARGI